MEHEEDDGGTHILTYLHHRLIFHPRHCLFTLMGLLNIFQVGEH